MGRATATATATAVSPLRHRRLLAAVALGAVLAAGGCTGDAAGPSVPSTGSSGATSTAPAGAVDASGADVTGPPDTAAPLDPAKVLAAGTLTAADLPPGFEARGEAGPVEAGPTPTGSGTACGPFLVATRRLDEVPNLSGPELVATAPDGRVVAKIEASTSVLPDEAEAAATVAELAGKDTCVRRAFASSLARSSPGAELELVPSAPLEVGDGGVRYSGRLTQAGASAQVFIDFFRLGPVVVQVTALDGAGRLSSIAGIEQALAGRVQVALASG